MPVVQQALASPLIHHRTSEFSELMLETRQHLQQIYRSDEDIVILSSSGTGAMEAAVASILRPAGDRALVVAVGKFGERWIDLCRTHEIAHDVLSKSWGEAAGPEEIVQSMHRAQANALLLQGCETSTGTAHDLESIAHAVRRDLPEALIIVDAITALASQPLETQAWQLDVVISGSQKSFAMSPGIAFLSLSPRAVQAAQRESGRSYYFNLAREITSQREGQSAYTPAISLIQALHASTGEILKEGLERIIRETALMAAATRAGLQALGFRLLSSAPANAVTAAFPPAEVNASRLIADLEASHGIKVAGGQGDLKGKILRIAHLGFFDTLDVFTVLSALELCLDDQAPGTRSVGAGVSAALQLVRGERVKA